MAEAEEKRTYDLDFVSIPVFDGKNKAKFNEWFRRNSIHLCLQQQKLIQRTPKKECRNSYDHPSQN